MSDPSAVPLWPTITTAAAAVVAAGVTAWMAISTRQMAQATNKSVKVTETALDLERQTLDHAKDALMPILDLAVDLSPLPISSFNPLGKLVMTNHGVGPALVREVTFRNEVYPSFVYQAPERHSTVTPSASVSLRLTPNVHFSFDSEDPGTNYLSSISVWYEDVYGRAYRSRLVFQYVCSDSGDISVIPLDREFDRPREIPAIIYAGMAPYPPGAAWMCEGGRVIPQFDLNLALVRLDAIGRIASDLLPECLATQGLAYYVRDWGFWLDTNRPQWTIEIPGHPQFILGQAPTAAPDALHTFVMAKPRFESLKANGLVGDPIPLGSDLKLFGLVNSTETVQLLEAMYDSTLTEVLSRLGGLRQPAASNE